MPKKTLGFCALLCAAPATAATCEPGYYLENGACQDCGSGFYCYDDIRYDCMATIPPHNIPPSDIIFLNARCVVNGVWYDDHASDASQCLCNWGLQDETRTYYFMQTTCLNGPNGTQYTKYDNCRTGYYATNPLGVGDWYTACAPCTNGSAHSHYTSYSTPSVMYAVESNCPWECDEGYGRVGDTCEPLCATGITHLRAGTASAPLFPVRRTTPALVVRTAGGVCYGNLSAGAGTGINIRVSGTTYRVE